jgi:hypothetical protein
VEIETFFAVGAVTVADKEVAFGHFAAEEVSVKLS